MTGKYTEFPALETKYQQLFAQWVPIFICKCQLEDSVFKYLCMSWANEPNSRYLPPSFVAPIKSNTNITGLNPSWTVCDFGLASVSVRLSWFKLFLTHNQKK